MPVRQTRVFVRSDEPQDDWAENLIGTVFGPLSNEYDDALGWFWFSRYGAFANDDSEDCDISSIPEEYKRPGDARNIPFHRSMRFRFDVGGDRREAFEKRAAELINGGGYRISDFRDYDFVGDTGRNRFLGVENRQPGRAKQRAILTTTFYWITSKLSTLRLWWGAIQGFESLQVTVVKRWPLGSLPYERTKRAGRLVIDYVMALPRLEGIVRST